MSDHNQIDNWTSIDHFKCSWKSITFIALISFNSLAKDKTFKTYIFLIQNGKLDLKLLLNG